MEDTRAYLLPHFLCIVLTIPGGILLSANLIWNNSLFFYLLIYLSFLFFRFSKNSVHTEFTKFLAVWLFLLSYYMKDLVMRALTKFGNTFWNFKWYRDHITVTNLLYNLLEFRCYECPLSWLAHSFWSPVNVNNFCFLMKLCLSNVLREGCVVELLSSNVPFQWILQFYHQLYHEMSKISTPEMHVCTVWFL